MKQLCVQESYAKELCLKELNVTMLCVFCEGLCERAAYERVVHDKVPCDSFVCVCERTMCYNEGGV